MKKQTKTLMERVSNLEESNIKMNDQISILTSNINTLTTTLTTEFQKLASIAPAVNQLTHHVNSLLAVAWPSNYSQHVMTQPQQHSYHYSASPSHQQTNNLKRHQNQSLFSPITTNTGVQPITHTNKKQKTTIDAQSCAPP